MHGALAAPASTHQRRRRFPAATTSTPAKPTSSEHWVECPQSKVCHWVCGAFFLLPIDAVLRDGDLDAAAFVCDNDSALAC